MGEITKVEAGIAPANEPVTDQGSAILSIIERVALNPDADIDKMERLFAMHERMADQQREAAYNKAMAMAQAEMPKVVANCYNDQTKSRYANIVAIADAALPVIHRHGLAVSVSQAGQQTEQYMPIKCEVLHIEGHCRTYDFNVPIDSTGIAGKVNKTKTHAFGSTLQYGRRYAICCILNVTVGQDDDGNGGGKTLTERQVDELRALCEAKHIPPSEVCASVGVSTWDEIPITAFGRLQWRLNQAAKRAIDEVA
ncbi:MAG: ERF family protein [Pseudomonadota bacterium]